MLECMINALRSLECHDVFAVWPDQFGRRLPKDQFVGREIYLLSGLDEFIESSMGC